MVLNLLTLALLTAAPEPAVPSQLPSLGPVALGRQAALPGISQGKPVQRARMRIREYLDCDDDSDGDGTSRPDRNQSNRAWLPAAATEGRCPPLVRPAAAAGPAAVPLIYTLCTLLL
jgi:hypothetical protein